MTRRPGGAGLPRAAAPSVLVPGPAVLVDTGALVALFNRNDPHHAAANAWLAGCDAALHSVEAVMTEASFFLPARLRPALAELSANGVIQVHAPDRAGHGRLALLLQKYRDLDPDWADLCLVWLAESTAIRRIATLDVTEFSVYRIHGRKRFELELLR